MEPVSGSRIWRLESRSQKQDELRDQMLGQLEEMRKRVGAIEDEKRELRLRLETSEARCRALDEEKDDMRRRLSDLQKRLMDPLRAASACDQASHSDAMHKLGSLEERLVNLEACVKDEVHSVFIRMKALLKKMESGETPPSPFEEPKRPFMSPSSVPIKRRFSITDTSSDSSLDSPTQSCKSIYAAAAAAATSSSSCKTLLSPPSPPSKPLLTSTPYRKKFFCSDLSLISEHSRASFKNRRAPMSANGPSLLGPGRNRWVATDSNDYLPGVAEVSGARRAAAAAAAMAAAAGAGAAGAVPMLPTTALAIDPSQSSVGFGVADLFFDPADKFIETALEEDSLIHKVANTFSLLFQSGLEDHMEDTQLWSSIQWAMTKGLHQSLHRCLESVPQTEHRSPPWDLFDTETILDLLKDK